MSLLAPGFYHQSLPPPTLVLSELSVPHSHEEGKSNQTEMVLAPKPPLSSECFLWEDCTCV